MFWGSVEIFSVTRELVHIILKCSNNNKKGEVESCIVQIVIDTKRKNCKISKCLFLLREKIVMVCIIIDLGLFLRITKVMHEW